MTKIKKQDWIEGYLIAYDEEAKQEIVYYLPHWESHTLDLMIRMNRFWRNYFMDEIPRIYAEIEIDENRMITITLSIHETGIKCQEHFSFIGERSSQYAGTPIARIFNVHKQETARMFTNEIDVLFNKFNRFLIQQFIFDKTQEWKSAKS